MERPKKVKVVFAAIAAAAISLLMTIRLAWLWPALAADHFLFFIVMAGQFLIFWLIFFWSLGGFGKGS